GRGERGDRQDTGEPGRGDERPRRSVPAERNGRAVDRAGGQRRGGGGETSHEVGREAGAGGSGGKAGRSGAANAGQPRYRPETRAGLAGILERVRAKWIPVRVKKTRQNKKLEPGFDSIEAEKALGGSR